MIDKIQFSALLNLAITEGDMLKIKFLNLPFLLEMSVDGWTHRALSLNRIHELLSIAKGGNSRRRLNEIIRYYQQKGIVRLYPATGNWRHFYFSYFDQTFVAPGHRAPDPEPPSPTEPESPAPSVTGGQGGEDSPAKGAGDRPTHRTNGKKRHPEHPEAALRTPHIYSDDDDKFKRGILPDHHQSPHMPAREALRRIGVKGQWDTGCLTDGDILTIIANAESGKRLGRVLNVPAYVVACIKSQTVATNHLDAEESVRLTAAAELARVQAAEAAFADLRNKYADDDLDDDPLLQPSTVPEDTLAATLDHYRRQLAEKRASWPGSVSPDDYWKMLEMQISAQLHPAVFATNWQGVRLLDVHDTGDTLEFVALADSYRAPWLRDRLCHLIDTCISTVTRRQARVRFFAPSELIAQPA